MSKDIQIDTVTAELLPIDHPDMDFLRSLGMGALDTLSNRDIIMPRYKLIQNTSKTGTPGKWVSNLSPDRELDELSIIILQISNYRTYFPVAGQGDRPICKSNDGYKMVDGGVGDGDCDSCRFAVWHKDDRGKSVPPNCKSGYTLLGIIALPDGTSEVGMVSLKGSAMRPAKQYFTRMKTRGVPPYAYISKIASASEVNDKGRFYKPVFEFGEYLSKDMVLGARAQANDYRVYITPENMADIENEDLTSHAASTTPFMDTQTNMDDCTF